MIELGRRVSCSPHYLSRALERISQGERGLAGLAHELGFADHAHLTRTIRAVTGHTPTACRGLL